MCFLNGQIVDMHSEFIDQARGMVNPVFVNEAEYSCVDKQVDRRGVMSLCAECEMQCFNKTSCT